MEHPVDDLTEAHGRIQAMEEATLGAKDWKPILPLLKPVVVAPALVVVTSVVPLGAVPRAAACTNYNMKGCIQSCVCEHAYSFCKGQHEAYIHVGHRVECLRCLVQGSNPPPFALPHGRTR
ncbi:BQ5605_C006g04090 [Microbotryum silenes-dioicae]|uniref:BQ5605_C006g04090 protein n=1 Tax=Microbotryum silenes-dioicae TaxID=796604 RepID=A0A2X0N065_9BASI|nr:BQ5605_C006g04090 [Microbotryum silenes-dioicae]